MKMSTKLEIWGNETTMNMENILLQNIMSCEYFKNLYQFKTFPEVIDEIWREVHSLDPWQGLQRIPSTAFCLLYKLFTLKLTEKQITAMLNHQDSPYIRALGFIYLRYCCPPKKLWSWFEPYKFDEEEFFPRGPKGSKTTIGKFCRSLLKDIRFYETIFPRIPVPVQRELNEKLKEAEIEEKEWEREQQKHTEEATVDEKNNSSARTKSRSRSRSRERRRSRSRERRRSKSPRSRSRERRRSRSKERRRNRSRSKSRERRRSRSRERRRNRSRSRSRERRRSRSRDRKRSKSPSPSQEKKASPLKSPPKSAPALDKIRALYGATTSTQLYSNQPSIGDVNSCETDVIRVGLTKKQ